MAMFQKTLGRQLVSWIAKHGMAGLRILKQNPAMILPFILILAVVSSAIFAPFIAPADPTVGSLSQRLLPPSWVDGGDAAHLLGTDTLGRDVLSRMIYGARVSLSVSLFAILIALVVGSIVGIASGYYGGRLDMVLMRIVDIFLSLPMILIAVVVAVILGPSFRNVVLVLGLMTWARWARQVRAETLVAKQQDFIPLAKVAGCTSRVIMARHIFPNVVPTLLVLGSLEFGHLVIIESSLSFLGVGVPPPTPSWGGMVAESRGLLSTAWWLPIMPGLCILASVLSMNSLGDWVRDKLDPKQRQV